MSFAECMFTEHIYMWPIISAISLGCNEGQIRTEDLINIFKMFTWILS